MPDAVYLNVVRPCWIYQDESKIKEKDGSTKSLSIFTGRATFAQIDDDLAAIIATGGCKSSCESVGATAAPCDQRTGHVVQQGPFGGEYLLRSEMDGDTGLYAMPNTEERSTEHNQRVTARAPSSSTAGVHSVAGTVAGRARDTNRAGANGVIDFGKGCGIMKTLHMSAAAVALHHQSVGDASKLCGFHKLVPDSGDPAINLTSVHAAGYDIYVSPRPLQQQHRSGSQSVGSDDTNKQCLSTPAMVVTVNPTVSISKSSSACSSKQSSLV
jgi:hypothetical protein